MDRLNVIWFGPPTIHHGAVRGGYLAKADLTIEGTATRSSDQQFEELVAGTQDLAVTAMDNVILWNRRPGGGDFRIIADVEESTGLALVAVRGIASIADLRGKRLLVDSTENGFVIVLRALLADAGVDFDACEIIAAGGVMQRLDAMLKGEGDATLLGPPMIELAATKGLHVLADAQQAYPNYPGQGVVVRQSLLEQKGGAIERWLGALEQGRGDCRSDPEATAAHIAAAGVPAASARQLASFVGGSLVVSREGVDVLIGQRRQLGLAGGDAEFDDLVDPGPVARTLASLSVNS